MSDHEFEKQVQRKMDELKLRPTDAVWTAVEKSIRQTRPRRRFGFWVPVFVVFLATTGYFLYSGNLSSDESGSIAKSNTINKTNDHSSTNSIAHNKKSTQPVIDNNKPSEDHSNSNNNSPINGAHPGQQQEQGTTGQHLDKRSVQSAAADAHETTSNTPVRANRHSNAVRVPYVASNNNTRRTTVKNNSSKGRTTKELVPAENTTTPEDEAPFIAVPQIAPNDNAAIATGKAAPGLLSKRSFALSTTDKTTAPVPPIQKQKSPKWQWGVQTGVGFSRISQSNLLQVNGWLGNSEKSLAEDLSKREDRNGGSMNLPGGTNNSFINAVPPVEKKPALIKQGTSFNIGVFAQRPLSKRLRLTLGLQYAYMSAHTNIGKLVEGPTIVNLGTASANVVTRYYTAFDAVSTGLYNQWQGPVSDVVSHKYTFRFHTIEAPVMLNWQINKGRQLPPFMLDAGLSIAQMISVDGLHYDGIKGIYYKDNDLFNKTSVNAILGFNVGLFQRSKLPVWIGPGFRYSLTGLVDKSVSQGQFIWSTGINIRMQLGRL